MTKAERAARDKKICEIAKEKKYLCEIVKETGFDEGFIRYILYKHGVRYHHKPNRLQSNLAKSVIELAGQMKEIEIARKLGCTRQYVNQVLKQKNKQELL